MQNIYIYILVNLYAKIYIYTCKYIKKINYKFKNIYDNKRKKYTLPV